MFCSVHSERSRPLAAGLNGFTNRYPLYNVESAAEFWVKTGILRSSRHEQSTTQHRCESPKSVRCAVITISDTRQSRPDVAGPSSWKCSPRGGTRRASGYGQLSRSAADSSRIVAAAICRLLALCPPAVSHFHDEGPRHGPSRCPSIAIVMTAHRTDLGVHIRCWVVDWLMAT